MMIQLKGLHKTYKGAQPLHVLKGIDLNIEEGELPCSTFLASLTTTTRVSTPWAAPSSKTSAKPKQRATETV